MKSAYLVAFSWALAGCEQPSAGSQALTEVGTMEPPPASIRFAVVGDHGADELVDGWRPDLVLTLPGDEGSDDFVRGPVHFFSLDGDSDEQAAWLQRELAASTSPWDVVYLASTALARWPFDAWGADLVLCAHPHADPPYVVNGLGGQGIEAFGAALAQSQVDFDAGFGALRVDANDTDLQLRFVSREGVVLDRLWLVHDTARITTTFQQGMSPTGSYAGTTDATVNEAAPTHNAGRQTGCRAGGDGSGTDLACLLRFELSDLPPGSAVIEVSLALQVTQGSPSPTWSGLRRSWAESQVTWDHAEVGAPWEVPGAKGQDDRGDAVASIGAWSPGLVELPLGQAGAELVQRWVDDPTTNFGLVLTDAATADGFTFASSEAATPSARPRLVVTWRP